MSGGLSVDAMAVIARVTYGDDQAALDFLESLPPADVIRTAWALATVASGLLGSLACSDDLGPDALVAHLMDAATPPP